MVALILAACLGLGLFLRADRGPVDALPPARTEVSPSAVQAPPPPAPSWDAPEAGAGVAILLKVVDRRWEPWPAQLTHHGLTRDVPAEGIRLRAIPDRRFGRLGGERLAARDWTPAKSESWEEQPDGSFVATAMLYPGREQVVRLEGPGAAVVSKVRCIDSGRRGVSCPGDASSGWVCACRKASRIGVYSDRWSIPWVASRARFEDGSVEVPKAVTACLRFPEVPAEERTIVVIAPQRTPLESAKEADSEAVAAGAKICVRAPVGEPMTVGLGGAFSPAWSGRGGEVPAGTRTWTVAPTTDGEVDLPPEGGWASWPVLMPRGGE